MAPSPKVFLLLVFVHTSLGARRLSGNANQHEFTNRFERSQRSLTNTFPFNQQNGADSLDPRQHGRQPSSLSVLSELEARDSRQGEDAAPNFAEVAEAGKKCIEKVEETEYDDVVQCDHSYDKRCHTTYITNYESQQEEDCEENFKKSCFIAYEQIGFNETVQVCRT